jgi:hypothetical protein
MSLPKNWLTYKRINQKMITSTQREKSPKNDDSMRDSLEPSQLNEDYRRPTVPPRQRGTDQHTKEREAPPQGHLEGSTRTQ